MRLVFQLLLVMLCLPALGQTDTSYRMTIEQNTAWLIKVKNSDKQSQLSLIKLRLIEHRQRIVRTDTLVAPILLVDGVQIAEDITQNERNFIITQVTLDIVDITILEKQTNSLLHHFQDKGVVLLAITDKKTSKNFFKLGRKSRRKR